MQGEGKHVGPSACRRVLLAAVLAASGVYSIAAAAKTITLSCPAKSGDPWIYSIDLDAGTVSASIGGAPVMVTTPATVTDSSITFIYEANLGNAGMCHVRNVIDRHTAGIMRMPQEEGAACQSMYSTAQCSLLPDNSF